MKEQLGGKDGEFGIVHEGYQGVVVRQRIFVVDCWNIPWVDKWIKARSIL